MALEYLKRFDCGLAARVRRMSAAELADLLAERFPAWQASGRRPFSEVLALALRAPRPFRELVDQLLAEGFTLTELRNDVVHDLCLVGEDVRLDTLGSYAEVFSAEPADALSSLDVLPGTDEEVFLLLRPQQLDVILQLLREHAGELGVRSPAQLEAIARLREDCAARPGQLVAFCFDA